MRTREPFQRARRPEQKEERRVHLLETARTALNGGMELADLGLNELARQAQMTKSNVYRYFENREALLLALLEEAGMQWQADLAQRLAAIERPAADTVARAFAATCGAHPLMCRLFSILPSIIEHNVSTERLADFKQNSLELVGQAARRLHHAMPAIAPSASVTFMRQSIALIIGLWPLSHPSPALAQALASPELATMRYDFETDLAAALALLLRGLAAAGD